MTETSPIVCTNSPVKNNRHETVGTPLPSTTVRLVDPSDSSKVMGKGETGEIAIKGPQVMKGYYNRPDINKQVFTKDGFFLTGDIGHIDADGHIQITDRKKDMMIINGLNVYTNKIERQLMAHPEVEEAYVIGVPNEKVGEVPFAFVRTAPGSSLDARTLFSFLESSGTLAKHETPRAGNMEITAENLPKTPLNKPDKKAMRQKAQDMLKATPAP